MGQGHRFGVFRVLLCRSGVVFLAGVALRAAPPAFAAEVSPVGTAGGGMLSLKIGFPNGNAFYYHWNGQEPATLGPSSSTKSIAGPVALQSFYAIPRPASGGVPNAPALYSPDAKDRVAVFATTGNWVVLFDSGKVIQVPMPFGAFLETEKVLVSEVASEGGAAAYGVVSYRLKSGKGATWLCDYASGEVRVFSRNFTRDFSKIKVTQEGDVSQGKRKPRRWNQLSDATLPPSVQAPLVEAVGDPQKTADEHSDSFRFKSGVQVVSPDSGVSGAYVKNGKQVRWITKEPVFTFPTPGGDFAWEWEYSNTDAAVLISASSGVWVVSQNGALVEIPMDLSKVDVERLNGRDGPKVRMQQLRHNGRSYSLVIGYYKESALIGPYNGEVFLVRDDGASFRVALSAVTYDMSEDKIRVSSDGLLSFDEIPRQIDLEKFEVEARLPIAPPFLLKDGEGNAIENPATAVLQEFPDILTRIRAGSLKTFPFLPGEEQLVESFRMALAQEESGSFALLGDSGSGKSQAVYAFLSRVAANEYAEIPRSIRVISVERGILEQGTKYVGTFESKVAMLKYLSRFAPLYVFADEMHSLRGAGTSSKNSVDFFEMIKTELADGSIRLIGTSTTTEFHQAFAGNEAILRRVFTVPKPASDETKTLQAMRGWVSRFKKAAVSGEVLAAVYRISSTFSAVGAQPSKATKLLDSSFAVLKMQSRPDASLTVEDVQTAARHLYTLKATHFDASDAIDRQEKLRPALDAKVIGLDAYKDALVQLNGLRLAGLLDPRRPSARVLVAGPTGVGKTALVETFAEAIGSTYYRVEMSKYANGGVDALRREIAGALRKDPFSVICLDEFEKADASVVLGLLSALDDGHFSVTETVDSSASSQSMTAVRVETSKASFIATTNAASRWLTAAFMRNLSSEGGAPLRIGFQQPQSSPQGKRKEGDFTELQSQLRMHLIAEGLPDTVVGRFNVVVAALPPTKGEFREVVRLHAESLLKSLSQQGASAFRVEDWDSFLDGMMERYFKPPVQARIVHTLLDTYLRPVILETTLREMRAGSKGRGTYVLRWDGKAFRAEPAESTCAAALGSATAKL